MTTNLRVLVIGPGAASVSDTLRFEAFVPALLGLGVELVSWSPPPVEEVGDDLAAFVAMVRWSQVVVLRRWYRTVHSCPDCSASTFDRAEIRAHATSTGHQTVESPFALVRPLICLLETEPGAMGGRALVYDTDDDVFAAGLSPGAEDWLERDLVARMLALADLVTTTTPVLAERLQARTGAPVRVIRNALDPAWYQAAPGSAPREPGGLRIVHHGVASRLRDYEVARSSVDTIAAETPFLRRFWLGATTPDVVKAVDEVRPWVPGVPPFAAALAATAPDIGLSPLQDNDYNHARSELHWLEYALTGAPAIVSGFDCAGPYDVVQDGRDGLVSRSSADWLRHLRDLVSSADLRAEISGRARERVLAEYTVSARAAEWADAYRCAAEHLRH